MPTYEYKCPDCGHRGTVRRPIDLRDERVGCSSCGSTARRLQSVPALIGATVAKTFVHPTDGDQ